MPVENKAPRTCTQHLIFFKYFKSEFLSHCKTCNCFFSLITYMCTLSIIYWYNGKRLPTFIVKKKNAFFYTSFLFVMFFQSWPNDEFLNINIGSEVVKLVFLFVFCFFLLIFFNAFYFSQLLCLARSFVSPSTCGHIIKSIFLCNYFYAIWNVLLLHTHKKRKDIKKK